MNARTAELDDYIRLADLQDYVDVPEEGTYLNSYIPSRSKCDKKPPGSGTWGCELLELCRSTELLIASGRTLGDVKREYTFTSPRGQSTVDYFIVSAEQLSSVADMKAMHGAQYCNLSCDVPHDGQKSDHFPLQFDLACTISINARSSSAQSSTCPQFKYVESQADAYQQCLTAELIMHLVPLLSGTVDVDTVVAILITCMTEAAQQTLPHKQK